MAVANGDVDWGEVQGPRHVIGVFFEARASVDAAFTAFSIPHFQIFLSPHPSVDSSLFSPARMEKQRPQSLSIFAKNQGVTPEASLTAFTRRDLHSRRDRAQSAGEKT